MSSFRSRHLAQSFGNLSPKTVVKYRILDVFLSSAISHRRCVGLPQGQKSLQTIMILIVDSDGQYRQVLLPHLPESKICPGHQHIYEPWRSVVRVHRLGKPCWRRVICTGAIFVLRAAVLGVLLAFSSSPLAPLPPKSGDVVYAVAQALPCRRVSLYRRARLDAGPTDAQSNQLELSVVSNPSNAFISKINLKL
ncbi:hypothetical protein B0H11DRAFT_1982212 [Mycena galericulata]|nr:hypothetical protein B0H11DRAFT_1982212 [Mycena galericulata]